MGGRYSPNITTSGLILCLDAANVRSYPGSGTTWFDLSGNGNNFTLFNSPTFANGAFTFDGNTQYARIGSSGLNLAPTGIRTIEIWTKVITLPIAAGFGGLFGDQQNTTGILRVLDSGKLIWGWDDGTTGNSTINISTGTWFQFVVLLDNYKATYYYNGQLDKAETTNSDTAAGNNNAWSIARQNRDFTGQFYYLNCEVSIARQYNRLLIAQEIFQNFNATRERFGV
jgi:hypothetical protein